MRLNCSIVNVGGEDKPYFKTGPKEFASHAAFYAWACHAFVNGTTVRPYGDEHFEPIRVLDRSNYALLIKTGAA